MTNIELHTLEAVKEACQKYIGNHGRQQECVHQQHVYEVAKEIFTRIPLCNNDNMTEGVAKRCINAAKVFVKLFEESMQ